MEASFDQLAEAIYKAPFVCLAHNKFEEGVTDPVFTYANKAALELFEGTWDTLVGMPSRLSAEAGAAREVGGAGHLLAFAAAIPTAAADCAACKHLYSNRVAV